MSAALRGLKAQQVQSQGNALCSGLAALSGRSFSRFVRLSCAHASPLFIWLKTAQRFFCILNTLPERATKCLSHFFLCLAGRCCLAADTGRCFIRPSPPMTNESQRCPSFLYLAKGCACVRFSHTLSYSEFLSNGNGAAERYAVVLVDRFNAHAVALRNGVEGIVGTYGVVRVFQHTGGFFPFLFQIDDVARRERGAARHFVVTAQTTLGFAGPFANGGVGVAGKGYDIETLVATVNTALGGGGGHEGGGGGRRLVRHEGGGGMAREMVVAMEAVALYEADEQMGVSGVGGVACRFESVGPAFVVVALEGEEGGIAAAPGEEEGMVFIGGKDVWIDTEFLSNGVVVFQHDGAGPRGACFDAEMVVGLGGKEALPGAALEEALGEGDAGGDAVFVHLLHGEGLVALDVGRVGVGLRAKDGEDGEEEAEGE